MQQPAFICFAHVDSTQTGSKQHISTVQHRLSEEKSRALAEILPILCCGEESAIVAFEGLALNEAFSPDVQSVLANIACEESHHETLLRSVRASLPDVSHSSQLIRAIKRFFMSMRTQDSGTHLANIAALDSGVCVIINLFHQSGFFHSDNQLQQIFGRIHRDESRHAAQTLLLAKQFSLNTTAMIQQAECIREGLREILILKRDAFDCLGVDCNILDQRLTQLPGAFLT